MIAYCNLAPFMTNSTFNLTCADDGSVNEYVYVCMYVCKMKIDNSSTERVEEFKYLGTTLTNKNSIQEEINVD